MNRWEKSFKIYWNVYENFHLNNPLFKWSLTHGLKDFWKICSNNIFLQFSEDFFANFRKFSGVRGGGLRPGPPTKPTPLKCPPPPEPKSCRRPCIQCHISTVISRIFPFESYLQLLKCCLQVYSLQLDFLSI